MSTLQERLQAARILAEQQLGGRSIELQRVPDNEVSITRLTIGGREELPIFITAADTQILCICYLWEETQINPACRTRLLEALLDLTLPMPLSSFGRIGERYVVFGALSCEASAAEIAEEISTLSDNAVDALEAFADYLQ